jgi:hypothetical protein
MSWFSRLFGGNSDPAPQSGAGAASGREDYNGFAITPGPIKDGGQFRVAARIEKDGKTHEMIRADTMASLEQATEISVRKARQMIDEQGDRLFG